jgi:pimeloyl-ACP methyl ester carboxylesterase
MRFFSIITSLLSALYTSTSSAHPSSVPAAPFLDRNTAEVNSNVSLQLFAELEELSRIVDISYCVGMTGISKPFECASRCDDFPDFELVDTFNTGAMMSDSCGYIALDHGTKRVGTGRIIVAFRGTYSIANTIVDLSTIPQEYVPYPDSPDNSSDPGQPGGTPQKDHHWRFLDLIPRFSFSRSRSRSKAKKEVEKVETKCNNCTVHTGFWTSWQNTRPFILPHVKFLREKYPDYRLDLVGHSLGGAVAALAGLEFRSLGWDPVVTTFGEPRVGNVGLRNYIDRSFNLSSQGSLGEIVLAHGGKYRRVTHVDDPVPLLPLYEWGYRSHAGEVFISKASLQPTLSDVRMCSGDDDLNCIAGAEADESWVKAAVEEVQAYDSSEVGLEFESDEDLAVLRKRWGIPARFKMWQLFFAHRDYFWRLGLCVPGGDPLDWGRNRYDFGNGEGDDEQPREEL